MEKRAECYSSRLVHTSLMLLCGWVYSEDVLRSTEWCCDLFVHTGGLSSGAMPRGNSGGSDFEADGIPRTVSRHATVSLLRASVAV